MTVEWFMSQENNRCIEWERITKTYALSMEDQMEAGAFWRARNYR